MTKQEKQELKVVRIEEYIRSGKYKDSWAMEIALESEFGHRVGRLSRFSRQDIDERIRQAGLSDAE